MAENLTSTPRIIVALKRVRGLILFPYEHLIVNRLSSPSMAWCPLGFSLVPSSLLSRAITTTLSMWLGWTFPRVLLLLFQVDCQGVHEHASRWSVAHDWLTSLQLVLVCLPRVENMTTNKTSYTEKECQATGGIGVTVHPDDRQLAQRCRLPWCGSDHVLGGLSCRNKYWAQ